VAGLDRNGWPDDIVIAGRLASEYAVVLASSAFPVAFGRKQITYCDYERPTNAEIATSLRKGKFVCPEDMYVHRSSFVDGGVFDNVPLGVLEEEMRERENRQYIFLDPDYRRPVHAEKDNAQNGNSNNGDFGLLSQLGFLGDTVATARQYELYNLIKYDGDEFNNNIRVPNRFFPLTASYFGNFGAFWGQELRKFDYAVGVYDAIYFLASLKCNGVKACMPETFKRIYNDRSKNSLNVRSHPSIDIVVRKVASREFKEPERWLGGNDQTQSPGDKVLINNQLRIFNALDYKELGPYDQLKPKPVPYGKSKNFEGFIKALKKAGEGIYFKPKKDTMLERIMELSDWDKDAWFYPVTSRLTNRQLALEKDSEEKLELTKVIALGVNTKYRDVTRPFTRSTAPRDSLDAWFLPYEIGADVSNGGLLASWEARLPFHIVGDSAISLKLTPFIWNRNQTGISRTGQLDIIGSFGIDTLAISSIGIGPSFNVNYSDNLAGFKKYNYGAMGYVGLFADKLRISVGMRSFRRHDYSGNLSYISFGITDFQGIFYWLRQ
jgi:hypothetical protein